MEKCRWNTSSSFFFFFFHVPVEHQPEEALFECANESSRQTVGNSSSSGMH